MKRFIICFYICLFAVSCSDREKKNKNGISTYVIVYDFASQQYKLTKRTIPSLKAPTKIANHIAQFYYKSPSNAVLDSESPIQLNLSQAGSSNLYLPEDVHTLNALSGYLNYDLLYSFHKKLGILTYSKWPKKVNIEALHKTRTDNASHNPIDNYTNYFTFKKNHVPTHLNPGVVAHEESHGIFYSQVYEGVINKNVTDCFIMIIDNAYEVTKECYQFFAKNNLNIELVGNNYSIFRGFNEGTADFPGHLITGESEYIYASLGYELLSPMNYGLTSSDPILNRIIEDSYSDESLRFPNQVELDKILYSIVRGTRAKLDLPDNMSIYEELSPSRIKFSYNVAGRVSTLLNIISQDIVVPSEKSHLSGGEYLYSEVVKRLSRLKTLLLNEGEPGVFFTQQLSFTDIFDLLFDEKIMNRNICLKIHRAFAESEVLQACKGNAHE